MFWILQTVTEGTVGRVAGWGETESNVSSPTLKMIDLRAVGYDTCRNKTRDWFRPYITTDKFCAHGDNENVCVVRILQILVKLQMSVWRSFFNLQGDSGGGFAEAVPYGNTNKFYLRGLVSVGSRMFNITCRANEVYTTFTNVQSYDYLFSEFANEDFYEKNMPGKHNESISIFYYCWSLFNNNVKSVII